MTKQELVKKIEERKDLADRAYNTYQQLQGQIALLRDMLKEATEGEKKNLPPIKEKRDKGTGDVVEQVPATPSIDLTKKSE